MTLQELFSAHKLATELQDTDHTIEIVSDRTNTIQPVTFTGISGQNLLTIDGEQIRDVIAAGYESTRASIVEDLVRYGVQVDPVAVAVAPVAVAAAPSVVGA